MISKCERQPANIGARGLGLRIAASCCALLAAALLFPDAAFAQTSPSAAGGFSQVWNKPVPPLRTIAISPQGQRLALLTDDGKIAVWHTADAKPLWSVTGQNVSLIRITDGAPGYLIACRTLDPSNRAVRFFSADTGKKMIDRGADGAIWDVSVGLSGKTAAFSTGSGSLYLYALGGRPAYNRISLRGLADSVDISSDESYVATGLWNGSGVDVFDFLGNRQWFIAGKATRRYDVTISPGSAYVLSTDYYNHNRDHPVLTLRKRTGKPVWTYDMGADVSHVTAATSSMGNVTVVSFNRSIVRGGNLAVERRMVAIDRAGQPLWRTEFGGPYLSPVFICFTPDETGMIYYDSDRRLYRMTLNHYQTDMWQLSAPVRAWSVTADNRYLAVDTVDDHLILLALH